MTYSTKCSGIGGRIKQRIADFKVEEITESGEKIAIQAFTDSEKKELAKDWKKFEISEKESKNKHLHLVLEKFNYDLNFAIRIIARSLRISRKRIGYAGLKDKRAISAQRISILNPSVEKLEEFKSRFIDLRPLEWSDERVEIGKLKGNKFTITIRNIELEEKELRKRIKECFKEMQVGIANFFGEQRFGGHREVTHLVGKELVKGNLKQAVMLYLTKESSEVKEEEQTANARKKLKETGDFKTALKEFPVKQKSERIMLHHLANFPNDFAGAIAKLPKHLRYLFTHSFQSFIFNRIIEERLARDFGLKEIEGDSLSENKVPLIPLIGYESKLSEGMVGEIERKVLEGEGVKPEQFKVRQMPEVSSKGSFREMILIPRELKLLSVESDEFNEGKLKAVIKFELVKGSYATTVLNELMKKPSY